MTGEQLEEILKRLDKIEHSLMALGLAGLVVMFQLCLLLFCFGCKKARAAEIDRGNLELYSPLQADIGSSEVEAHKLKSLLVWTGQEWTRFVPEAVQPAETFPTNHVRWPEDRKAKWPGLAIPILGTSTNRFVETPVWLRPHMAEVSLDWEPSPDASFYRVYARSSKTTNQWTTRPEWLVTAPDDRTVAVKHVVVMDMSVPTETQVTAISAGQLESAPTSPVKHPAIVPPRSPGQHRHMMTVPLETAGTRRSRMPTTPVLPPLPLP